MEQNVTFKDAGDTKGITVVSNYADLRHALCSAQPMTICVDGYIDCGVNPVVLFPGQRIVGKIPGNKRRFPKSKPSGLLMRICGQAPAVLMGGKFRTCRFDREGYGFKLGSQRRVKTVYCFFRRNGS